METRIKLTFGSFNNNQGEVEVTNNIHNQTYELSEEFLGEMEKVLRLDSSFKIGGKSIETQEIEIHGFRFLDRKEIEQFLNWFDKNV